MNSPRKEYDLNCGVKDINNLAYDILFDNYFKKNLKGQNKVIDLEDTDQESVFNQKFGSYAVPGMIYTFIYNEALIVKDNKRQKEFIDIVPLAFCLTTDREGFKGINLNMLPVEARVSFLQNFYDVFIDFLEREVDVLAQNNLLALNKKFINYMAGNESRKFLAIFNKIASENFSFGFRKYNYRKIRNFRTVEYAQWKYIPHYEPKDAFRKMNLGEIYNLYNKSK